MSGWGGRKVTEARRAWATRLPVPCSKCGRDVEPDQPWHLDHLDARAIAPQRTWDPANLWPAHKRCNERDGGRMGAQRRWAKAGRRPSVDRAASSRPW